MAQGLRVAPGDRVQVGRLGGSQFAQAGKRLGFVCSALAEHVQRLVQTGQGLFGVALEKGHTHTRQQQVGLLGDAQA